MATRAASLIYGIGAGRTTAYETNTIDERRHQQPQHAHHSHRALFHTRALSVFEIDYLIIVNIIIGLLRT